MFGWKVSKSNGFFMCLLEVCYEKENIIIAKNGDGDALVIVLEGTLHKIYDRGSLGNISTNKNNS